MYFYCLTIVNVPVCQSISNSITLVSPGSGISALIFVPHLTSHESDLCHVTVWAVGFQSQVTVNSVGSERNGKFTQLEVAVQL